jgi:adenine phosphoribosyltransferase
LFRTFFALLVIVVDDERYRTGGSCGAQDNGVCSALSTRERRRGEARSKRGRYGGEGLRSLHVRPFLQAIRLPGSNPDHVEIEAFIRAIPDFPIPGILFRDITPLLKDKQGFRGAIDLFVERFRDRGIDHVVAIESRGYIFGAPVAYAIGAGFIPIRKPGKLPYEKLVEDYALEYGTNSLEIHADALVRDERVLVVDDLLATGGTAAATGRLLERLGARIEAYAFLVELTALRGRAQLGSAEVVSFVAY